MALRPGGEKWQEGGLRRGAPGVVAPATAGR